MTRTRNQASKPEGAMANGPGNLLALEPRVLLDAALGAEILDGLADGAQLDSSLFDGGDEDNLGTSLLERIEGYVPPQARDGIKELVFIDERVADYQRLIDRLSRDAEVVLIEEADDGVETIRDALANRQALSAVHIISHGEAGRVVLGRTVLEQDNLSDYANSLAEWGAALGKGGDILLYGCDIGAGEQGGEFLAILSRLSGADVAASDDLTGIDGDWELEVSSGKIEATPLLNANADYGYNLQPPSDIALSNNRIGENVTDGTPVGTLTSTDLDPVGPFTYAILSDTSGAFAISGDQLVVADASLLDFETATSHQVEIQTTDSGNESYSEIFTIALLDQPDDIHWIDDGGDFQWMTAANWDLGRLPTSTDIVHITNDPLTDASSSFLVYINGAAQAGSLYLTGEVLNIESGSLEVHDYAEAGYLSTVNHLDGTVTGGGDIVSYGIWNWSGGLHTGSGTTQVEQLNIISGKDKVLDGRLLKNMGWSSTFSAGDNFSLAGGGVLNNVGELSVLNIPFGARQVQASGTGGTFINEGYLYQGATSGFVVDSFFDNYGIVDLLGSMTVTGGGSQVGGLIQGAEAQFYFSGGTHALDNATLGDTVFYVINAGTVRVDSVSTATSGTGVSLDGGSITGAGDLTLHGAFSWNSGTQSGAGRTIVSATGDLYIEDGGVKTLDGRILDNQSTTGNSGWGFFVSDPLVIRNTEFINSGVFTFRGDGEITDQGTGAGALRNEGELYSEISSGDGLFSLNTAYEGSGSLTANWGGFGLNGDVNAPNGEFILNGGYISSLDPVSLQGGHLRGNGNFNADLTTGDADGSGGVAPGFSAGIINIAGDWTNTQSSVIDIELGGTTAGTGTGFHDQINVSDIATLGGTLNVTLIDSHIPTGPGVVYTVITGGDVLGDFVTINLPDISANGLAWNIQKTTTDTTTEYELITVNATAGAPYDIILGGSDARDVGPAGAVVGALSALDADSNAADMTYSIVSDPTGGGFDIIGSGTTAQLIVADPTKLNAAVSPTVVVRIQVADELANTYEKDFVIHIAANQAPVATKDVEEVWEDQTSPISGNVITVSSGYGTDYDPDGDGFQVTQLGGADIPGTTVVGSYGSLSTWDAGGYWEYELDNTNTTVQGLGIGEELWDSFVYTITDDFGATAQETLYINIFGDNDQPEFTSTPVTVASTGNPYSYAITAQDKDVNDTLSFWENSTLPSWLQLVDNGNGTATLQGTPGPSDTAPSYNVDLLVQDGNDGSGYQSFTIFLNGPTSISLDNKATGDWVPANTPIGTLSSTDPDSTAFTYTLIADSTGTPPSGTFAIGGANSDELIVANSSLLDASLSATETIRVLSEDEAGNPFEQEFVIDILPNRAPAATNNGASVFEDGALTHTANLITSDEGAGVDIDLDIPLGQTLSVLDVGGFTTGPTPGSYGELTWNLNGAYTYTLDNTLASVQQLAAGDTLTDTFTYRVADGYGGDDTADLIVTINGANDAPTPVGTILGQVNYDGDAVSIDVSGNFEDVDAGDTLDYTATGLPAGLSLDVASGVISGTISDGASTASPYTVIVSATDVGNLSASQTFFWNVNDPAITASDNSAVAVEDNATTASGNLITDDDGAGVDSDLAGSPLRVTMVDNETNPIVTGTYGSLSWSADGDYSYTLDNTSGAVQALAAGETVSESFIYTVTNDRGNFSSATLTVEISGVNDAPYLISPLPALDSLDGDSIVDLDLSGYFGDVDNGDTLSFSASGLPAGLVMDAAGLVNGVIAADASATGSFAVRVAAFDGGEVPVTGDFTWNIANPAPVATINKALVAEDGVTQASGNLLSDDDGFGIDRDPDGDGITVQSIAGVSDPSLEIAGSYGTLTWSAAGDYIYTLDNTLPEVQALGVGQTLSESFAYTIVDGQGDTVASDLIVTINGANDAPIAVGAVQGQVNYEGDAVSIDVSGNFQDVDAGDTLDYTATGLPAGLSIDIASGVISGTISDGANTASPYTVIVYATDDANVSASQSFSWNVNDPAITASDNSAVAVEDSATTASGNLITDDDGAGVDSDLAGSLLRVTMVDNGTNPIVTGTYGSLSWSADGGYSYTLDNTSGAVQALAAGEIVSASFIYTVTNGRGNFSSATLTVEISGVNDAPYLISPLPALDSLDGDSIVDLDLSGYFGDVDNGDLLSFSASGLPTGLTMDEAGKVSGVIDSAASAVGAFSVVVEASDGSGVPAVGDFTWRVGNPLPIATRNIATVGGEGLTTASGNLLSDDDGFGVDQDPDGDGVRLQAVGGSSDPTIPLQGEYGTLSWAGSGDYLYTLNAEHAALLALGGGQSLSESFGYTIVDGQGGSASSELYILIQGENDSPLATPIPSQSDQDGAFVEFSVAGYFSDPDGDPLSYTISDLPAGLSFSPATGMISGTLAADASQGSPWNLEVTASDPSGALATSSLIWDISNPSPVAGDDSLALTRTTETAVGGNLLGNDQDPDGDGLLVTAVAGSATGPVAGAYGTLSWSPDGSYSYLLDLSHPELDSLPIGGTLVDSFSYTLSDAQGALASASLTVSILDSNRPPQAFDNLGEVVEDEAPQLVGNLILDESGAGVDMDPDGDALSVVGLSGLDRYGVLSWQSNGEYIYDLNNGDGAIQALAQGETLEERYAYIISDGHGGTSEAELLITIVGSNDGPRLILPFDAQQGTAGDAVDGLVVLSHFEDVDRSDDLTFSVQGLPPGLQVDAQGRIVGKLAVDAGQDTPYQVRVEVRDPHDARAEGVFEWHVEPAILPDTLPIEEPQEPDEPKPQKTDSERREGEFIIHVVRGEGLDELYIQQTLKAQTEQQGQQQERRAVTGQRSDLAALAVMDGELEGDAGEQLVEGGTGGLSDQLDAAGSRFNQERQAILDILEKAGQLVGCGK